MKGWVGLQFTHKVVTCPVVSRAQDRESLPIEADVLPTVLCSQPMSLEWHVFFTVVPVRTVCVSFCCIVALFCWFLTQFLRGIQFQRVAPKVHGTCGRLVVMEHGGQPLTSYLDELFVDRAELAMQLLSMVQVFWVRLHFRFFTLRSQHLCFQIFVWWVLPVVIVPICTECRG